ncbi:hypothetical protein BH23ACT2_BH23ACT2_15190 [soil metagenome]
MRVHISLDDDLMAQLDRRVGARGRSRFIAAAVEHVLADEQRWEDIESGFGAIADGGHEWDDDPAGWVAAQRSGDAERLG